jgi:CRISPR/Cas system-associated protein Cas5 (RAMP superfamily)
MAHSKEGRVSKHTTQEVRARRCTQKEVRLENSLPKVVEGSKAHLKGGRVRKHITQEVRARKYTKKQRKVRKHITQGG